MYISEEIIINDENATDPISTTTESTTSTDDNSTKKNNEDTEGAVGEHPHHDDV